MLIKNTILYDELGERNVDIRIENGIIAEIGKNLKSDNIIEAKGAYFLPLLVDLNIRLLDSNLNSKNINTISKEALSGGVGHIVLNPDSNPKIDNEIVLEFSKNAIRTSDGAKVDLMINTLQEDASLSDISILLKSGAKTSFMSTIAKNDVVMQVAKYIQMLGGTLFCKAEDNSLKNSGVMFDGFISSKLGLAGIPDLSEVLHVSRMIEISRHFKIKILFKSIASPRSIKIISRAKSEGVSVSCEVSVHHLICSDKKCENFNTTAKLDPPLVCEDDVLLLQKALKNNEIDILTSLHQPSSPVHKEVAFFYAHYGCESIGEIMSIYYTKLVKTGLISIEKLLELTVKNPLKSIGLSGGYIEVGQNANAMLFDTKLVVKIDNSQSLYDGEVLSGKVVLGFVGERVIEF